MSVYSKKAAVVFFLVSCLWSGPTSRASGTDSAAPMRVISMGPNITEAIFALGQGDRLVGVTDFCIYPPEAKDLPRVGGFFNPNLERMTALRPDLVVLQGKHDKVDAFCRAEKVATLHVAMDSIATIYSGITALGGALGACTQAHDMNNAIRRALDSVRAAVAPFARKKVFVSLGRAMGSMAHLYTVGGASFVSELIAIAGGDNIFADVKQPYPEVSKESLIKRAPDVILEMRPGEHISDARQKQIAAQWHIFANVPAVSNHRVYIITEDFVLLPGPRIGKAAHVFAQILHGAMRHEP